VSLLEPRTRALAIIVIVAAAVVAVAQAAPRTGLISKTSAGEPADGHSHLGQPDALSGSGRFVVFESRADNLPGGDGVNQQVYVRDTRTDRTRLVSRDGQGGPIPWTNVVGGISANGRFIAFRSAGAGLPQANGQEQVWLYDRRRDKTRLVSKDNSGAPGDLGSFDPSVSATGRFVVFASSATNLPGATSGEGRVYVRDLKRRRTIVASKTPGDAPTTGGLYGQTISADGRRVTFYSSHADLPGTGGVDQHVYVRDLDRRRTLLVDRTRGGAIFENESYNSSISGNGRFVIFEHGSVGSNQIYVRDLKRKRTRLAGRNSAGQPQSGYGEFAHLSGSGRYAVFVSDAANLPGGDGLTSLTYVRDLKRGKTRLASKAAGGVPADSEATNAAISQDGRWVGFDSGADNLGGNTSVIQVFRAGPAR